MLKGPHTHQWSAAGKDHEFFCSECPDYLTVEETLRRLSAVDQLSAEDAKREATEHDCMSDDFRASLFDYASALEGE
jgi:hypothetical protein